MVAVRKTNRTTSPKPDILVTRALGTIERIAEAMWEDDVTRETGSPPAVRWPDVVPAIEEKWVRRATAGFLALLETREP